MELPYQDTLFRLPGEATESAEAPRFQTPERVEFLKTARLVARLAFAPISPAFADLGGGIENAQFKAQDLVYGTFIDNYKPWKKEITAAFEQFNLPVLGTDVLLKMTIEDKNRFAHFYTYFVEHLRGRSGVLRAPGSALTDYLAGYHFEDDEAARQYGEELKELRAILMNYPLYDTLHNRSQDDKPTRKVRDTYVNNYLLKYGTPVLALDTHLDKYKFAPISDQGR